VAGPGAELTTPGRRHARRCHAANQPKRLACFITLPAGKPLNYGILSEACGAIAANNGPAEGVSIIVSLKNTRNDPQRPSEGRG
jgi:hypothetical protein